MSEVHETNLIEIPVDQQQALVRKSFREALADGVDALVKLGEQVISSIDDADAIDKVGADYRTIRDSRIAVEKRRKDIKQPYLEACKAIDSTAREITDKLQPAEDKLKAQLSWVSEEQEKRKQALVHSRIRQLEETGFELATNEEDESRNWVVGDVLVAESSLSRLGDERFARILRKGAKAKAAIVAELERIRREEEEKRREEERLAAIEAAKAKEQEQPETPAVTKQPGSAPDETIEAEIVSSPPPSRPAAVESVFGAKPSGPPPMAKDHVDVMMERITELEAAYHPDMYFFTRSKGDGRAIELCVCFGQPEGETLPIPDRVFDLPIINRSW